MMTKKQAKDKIKELASNAVNVASFLTGSHIPVPAKYPPSFVIIWDEKKKRPAMMRGTDYFNLSKRNNK